MYRNVKDPDVDFWTGDFRFPLTVGDEVYPCEALEEGLAYPPIFLVEKKTVSASTRTTRYACSFNVMCIDPRDWASKGWSPGMGWYGDHGAFQPTWARAVMWPYKGALPLLHNLVDQVNFQAPHLFQTPVGHVVFRHSFDYTEWNFKQMVVSKAHIIHGSSYLTLDGFDGTPANVLSPQWLVWPWHALRAYRCVMGIAEPPAIDRSKYPHDCCYCGKPAYLGPINSLDCSANCGALKVKK